MKNLKLTAAAIFMSIASFAQTAPDFTATDCSSASHSLYDELSGGNVVVMVWVMPCSNCILGAKAAYDAAQSFAVSHPGKVKYFISDDAGNTSCSALLTWANSAGITSPTAMFGNSPVTIDEANYGGSGMPHVMVIGSNHDILFNALNGAANNLAGITAAINLGLSPASVNDANKNAFQLQVFPNPASSHLDVNFSLKAQEKVTFNILNSLGQSVESFTKKFETGNQKETLNTASLSNGMYSLNISSDSQSQTIKFTIAK